MNIKILSINVAKNIFQLHGADSSGKAVLRVRIPRKKLTDYVANLSCEMIAMESCSGANYWARIFQQSGYTVKLISPQFVKPFVKTNSKLPRDYIL